MAQRTLCHLLYAIITASCFCCQVSAVHTLAQPGKSSRHPAVRTADVMTSRSVHNFGRYLCECGIFRLGQAIKTIPVPYLGPRRKARLRALHLFPSPGIRGLSAATFGRTAPVALHPSPCPV